MLDAADEAGVAIPLPEPPPELPDELDRVWDAFCLLSRSRSWGFGSPQPIDVVSLRAALDEYGVEGAARGDWLYWLQEADGEWLKRTTERIERERDNPPRGPR